MLVQDGGTRGFGRSKYLNPPIVQNGFQQLSSSLSSSVFRPDNYSIFSMHLSPVMSIPYIPSNISTGPANSKPRQTRDPPTSVPAPRLVPGERRIKPRLSKPSLDPVLESDQRLSKDVEQMVSGEATKVTRKHSLPILSRRRSDFFEETFSSRHADDPGDRIRNESVVLAEIKTNVIVSYLYHLT